MLSACSRSAAHRARRFAARAGALDVGVGGAIHLRHARLARLPRLLPCLLLRLLLRLLL